MSDWYVSCVWEEIALEAEAWAESWWFWHLSVGEGVFLWRRHNAENPFRRDLRRLPNVV